MSVIVSVVDCESQTFFQPATQKHYENNFPSSKQTRNIPKHRRSVLREIRPCPYYNNNKPVLVRQVENPQRIPVPGCEINDDVIILESQNIENVTQISSRVIESSSRIKASPAKSKKPSRKVKEPQLPVPISTGFEAGYEAEAIVGAKDGQQGIFYLVKWKEREEMELVPALTTLTYVPSLVILFYAKRLQWIVSSLSAPG